MFGAGAGSGAGGVATGGEWSPAPPSLHRRPRTTLAEEPDPSSRRHIVSGVPRCRCSRYAIRPAGAAEGDPMQVWTPRIVSLSALPSPGPRALLAPPPTSQPPCRVHLCPVSTVGHCGATPRKAMRSGSRMRWALLRSPSSRGGVYFDFMFLILCTQVYSVVCFCFRI